MSYEEKGTWVYLVVSVAVYGVYLSVILGRAGDVPLTEVPFVAPMLWTIGIAIVSSIIVRILVEMVTPSDTYKIDVRDKDIRRLGDTVTGNVVAVGMLLPFGLALAGSDHFWIANAMYAVYVLSAVVSAPVKLVAYRQGL